MMQITTLTLAIGYITRTTCLAQSHIIDHDSAPTSQITCSSQKKQIRLVSIFNVFKRLNGRLAKMKREGAQKVFQRPTVRTHRFAEPIWK